MVHMATGPSASALPWQMGNAAVRVSGTRSVGKAGHAFVPPLAQREPPLLGVGTFCFPGSYL